MDARRKALGQEVWDVVSERATARIPRAAHGVACCSMPAVLHGVHEIVPRAALTRGRRVRQAPKDLEQAAEALARLQGLAHAAHAGPEATAEVEARRATVPRRTPGPPWRPSRTRGSLDLRPGRPPMSRRGVDAGLLPLVSWEHHATRTRCARRKAKMRQALEAVQGACQKHAITQPLAP